MFRVPCIYFQDSKVTNAGWKSGKEVKTRQDRQNALELRGLAWHWEVMAVAAGMRWVGGIENEMRWVAGAGDVPRFTPAPVETELKCDHLLSVQLNSSKDTLIYNGNGYTTLHCNLIFHLKHYLVWNGMKRKEKLAMKVSICMLARFRKEVVNLNENLTEIETERMQSVLSLTFSTMNNNA